MALLADMIPIGENRFLFFISTCNISLTTGFDVIPNETRRFETHKMQYSREINRVC